MRITRTRTERIEVVYNTDEERTAIFELAKEEAWNGIYSGPIPSDNPLRKEFRYRAVWWRDVEGARDYDTLGEDLKFNLRRRTIQEAVAFLRAKNGETVPLSTYEARFMDELRAEKIANR